MSNKPGRQTDKVYEILRRSDGSFDIFHNGELSDSSVADRWLEDQLGKYGICGEEYRGVRSRLDSIGEARLILQTGRIKTKFRTSNNSVVRLKGI